MSRNGKTLRDLTRWNRCGLSRFDYVDGDAAVWLEELRIAMLGLYLRGGTDEARLARYWRDAFLRDQDDWPDMAAAAERVAWKRLAPKGPPQRETRGQRNERLLRQYHEVSDDYSWEVNRAFARASHILLGYLDAYANEGYLRTATQWDNLRRLAAMVNYQPTPPASATTTVGLILNADSTDVIVPRGLAMKHTPPEGGAPLIFETLQEVSGHPSLNAARASQWNENHTDINFDNGYSSWHLAEDKSLTTGDLVVLASGTSGEAHTLSSVDHDSDNGQAKLGFVEPVKDAYPHYRSRLWAQPLDVRVGLHASRDQQVVLEVENISAVFAGDLVEVWVDDIGATQAGTPKANKERYGEVFEVVAAQGDTIVLKMDLPGDHTSVKVRHMLPYALNDDGSLDIIASKGHKVWLPTGGDPAYQTGIPAPVAETDKRVPGLRRFKFENTKSSRAFSRDNNGNKFKARVKRKNPGVFPGSSSPQQAEKTVSFGGKPPKGLADGDWFVARHQPTGAIKALRVTGIRVAAGEYHVEFHKKTGGAHERTEFHGPMKLALASVGHDRNPEGAFSGNKVTLENIPEAARILIKPGRSVLIRRQSSEFDASVAARVEEARALPGNQLELALIEYSKAGDWPRGEMSFLLNTAPVSHGESKGSKLLGSGDGERGVQVFEFDIRNVSHIPSTAAESGVAPDMTIAINGERWDYRDFIDPDAANTRAWSTTLTDKGTLRIHFRRRLVTGQNNVVVTRYRVGAGAAGSNIAPFSFTRPMQKHRHVAAVFQPFATAGGADREAVSKLRQSTPKRLSANGRAVSLSDFENLATRHASVLRAHAELVPTASSLRMVSLTVALTNGGSVNAIASELSPAITARALPGIGVSFRDYEHLPLHVAVTVRADLSVFNRTDIKAAALARLNEVFSLENREFGQTAYISEILATLETVTGIENAVVDDFGLGQAYDLLHDKPADFSLPWPRNIATVDGAVAAIYATEHQIIHVAAGVPGAVAIEVETSK